MGKSAFKPGNMLYPLPAVMVSCQYPGTSDPECSNPALSGRPNILTVAWAGTVCTNPPMLSISVRPERYSYHMIEAAGEFVVNLTTESLVRATDYCGVIWRTRHSILTGLSAMPGTDTSREASGVRCISLNLSTSLPERTPQ